MVAIEWVAVSSREGMHAADGIAYLTNHSGTTEVVDLKMAEGAFDYHRLGIGHVRRSWTPCH